MKLHEMWEYLEDGDEIESIEDVPLRATKRGNALIIDDGGVEKNLSPFHWVKCEWVLLERDCYIVANPQPYGSRQTWYLCEIRGVMYCTFVHENNKQFAMKFSRVRAEVMIRCLRDASGVDLEIVKSS